MSRLEPLGKDLSLIPLIGVLGHRLSQFHEELEDSYILRSTLENEEDYESDEDFPRRSGGKLEPLRRRIDQLEKNFAIYADLIRKSSADETKRRKLSTETIDVESFLALMVEFQADVIKIACGNGDRRFMSKQIADKFQDLADDINAQ